MELISRDRLATLLDVSPRTVKSRLTKALIEPVKSDGRADLYDSGVAIRAVLVPDTDSNRLDLQQERAALARAQREHYDLRNAEALGRMVPTDIVTEVVEREYTAVRGRVRSMSSALAPELAQQDERHCQSILDKGIDDVLHELRGAGLPGASPEQADDGARER